MKLHRPCIQIQKELIWALMKPFASRFLTETAAETVTQSPLQFRPYITQKWILKTQLWCSTSGDFSISTPAAWPAIHSPVGFPAPRAGRQGPQSVHGCATGPLRGRTCWRWESADLSKTRPHRKITWWFINDDFHLKNMVIYHDLSRPPVN
jgi:hypothetical protein